MVVRTLTKYKKENPMIEIEREDKNIVVFTQLLSIFTINAQVMTLLFNTFSFFTITVGALFTAGLSLGLAVDTKQKNWWHWTWAFTFTSALYIFMPEGFPGILSSLNPNFFKLEVFQLYGP